MSLLQKAGSKPDVRFPHGHRATQKVERLYQQLNINEHLRALGETAIENTELGGLPQQLLGFSPMTRWNRAGRHLGRRRCIRPGIDMNLAPRWRFGSSGTC